VCVCVCARDETDSEKGPESVRKSASERASMHLGGMEGESARRSDKHTRPRRR